MNMTKKYIEFGFPGVLVSETSVRPFTETPTLSTLPKHSYGYRTFERIEVEVDGETLKGEDKNYSGWTFFGRELTLDQVKDQYPDEETMISNLESNGYDRVAHTITKGWFPMKEKDRVA